MGIKDFRKVFTNVNETKLEKQKNQTIAVDASIEIFRSSSVYGVVLTNPSGECTKHINTLLSLIIKSIENNIRDIWIFDSPINRADKLKTLDKRKQQRVVNDSNISNEEKKLKELMLSLDGLTIEEIKEVDPEYDNEINKLKTKIEKLKCRTVDNFGQKIIDIKFILECLGIEYIQIKSEAEAEEVGAYLTHVGIADSVRTTDVDALVFGAKQILKKIPGKSGVYNLIRLDECLNQYALSMNEFIEVCVALGCDFADKYPRIGPKRVIPSVKTPGFFKWTNEQKMAIRSFQAGLKYVEKAKFKIVKNKRTKASVQKLLKWLVDEQGFDQIKTEKKLSKIE